MRTVEPTEWCSKKQHVVNPQFGQPGVGRLESRLRRSLRAALREYLRHSSLGGVKNALDGYDMGGMRTMDTLCRVAVLVLVVLGVAAAGGSCWWRLEAAPRAGVSLPFQEHSIDNIHFPAVALCSYSILSKDRVTNYAHYLYEQRKRSSYIHFRAWTPGRFYRELMKFAALVDMTAPNIDKEFMFFLRQVDPARGYNVTDLMYSMNTPCSEQLVHCSWRGVDTPCEQLFQLRATPHGFCCTFNSRYEDADRDNTAQKLGVVGQDEGLSVIVHRNEEVVYRRRPGSGTEVLLFDGREYPLMEGGAVRSYPAPINVSVFVVLSAYEQVAEKEIEFVPTARLGCRTRKGKQRLSYGWCLTQCKRRALQELCGCLPYYYLPEPGDLVCSINHLFCLNKYREKLLFFYPENVAWSSALGEEFARSLFCNNCRPDCTRIRYSASVYVGTYYDRFKIFKNYFTRNAHLGNTTVLRIFYTTEDQLLYSIGVTEQFHEFFGAVGAQFILLSGMTVMVLFELTFHLLVRWPYNYLVLKNQDSTIWY